jgi:hypothetical protein
MLQCSLCSCLLIHSQDAEFTFRSSAAAYRHPTFLRLTAPCSAGCYAADGSAKEPPCSHSVLSYAASVNTLSGQCRG